MEIKNLEALFCLKFLDIYIIRAFFNLEINLANSLFCQKK